MDPTDNKKKIFFNSIVVIAASIYENLVFLIINVIVARYLSPEHYGEYTTAIAFATFFIAFCDIGINQTFVQEIVKNKKQIKESVGSVIILKSVLTVSTYGTLSISLFFVNYEISTIILTLIFGLIRLCSDYLKTFYNLFDVKEQFIRSSIVQTFFNTSVLIAAIAVIIMGKDYYALFLSRLAVSVFLLCVVITVRIFIRKNVPAFNFPHAWEFFKKSIPFGLSSYIDNIILRASIIIISLMLGTFESGIFNNAFMFITALLFIPKSAERVLIPFLYRHDRKTNKMKFQYAFDIYGKYLSIFGFYLALIFFLFSNEAISHIFGSKYSKSIPVLEIISLSIPFIFSMAGPIITSTGKQKIRILIEGSTVPINIISALLLIKIFGIKGAAVATFLTYVFTYILYHTYLKVTRVLNPASIVGINIKLLCISAICFLFHKYTAVNFGLILNVASVSGLFLLLTATLMIRRKDLDFALSIIPRKQ